MNHGFYIKTNYNQLRLVFTISFLITFFIPVMIHAQYGIKIGVTTSSFYFPGTPPDPLDEYTVDLRPYLGYDVQLVQTNPQKPLLAPCISIFNRFKLSKRLGVQPELSFTQKGVDFSYSRYESIVYKVKINYLEIPLSLSYQYLQKEKLLSHIYWGGYLAHRISAFKNVSFHHTSTQKTKLKSVKNFDFGVNAGIDFRHRIKDHFLLVDLRLFLGLNDIFFTPDDWTNLYFQSHKTKVTGINLSIGYEL